MEAKKQARAVALKYRHGKDPAPKVVAKGEGDVAEEILEIARRHGIPLAEDVPLVEALCRLELLEEIPVELYVVVAEILAYVYRVTGRGKEEG